jgi:cysteine desulfurase/selenocysteine lyase
MKVTNHTKIDYRHLFSHVNTGEIYLNHAAISPLPKSTVTAIRNFLNERENGPIENFDSWIRIVNETRSRISELINAPAQHQATFMGNTSDAISTVAEGFSWNAGDQIILNSLEFPSNVHPFRIFENKGVQLIYVKPDRNGYITPEILEQAVTPKTRMLSISAVQYLTGFRADLEAIGRLCRHHDIYFIVDAIQGLGAVNIDVQKSQIDALATGAHKWLMSPMGTGFLYLSDRLSENLKPAKTGWLSVENPWDLSNFNQNWLPVSRHLETGTYNIMGITGLNESLKMILDIGIDIIEKKITTLSGYISDKITVSDRVSLFSPVDVHFRAGIVTFKLDGKPDPEETVSRLKDHNITISAREGYFRISPHFYNTFEEIDIVLEHLFD